MRGSSAGLAETLKEASPRYYTLLVVLDSLFSGLVVAPAVVGYWRSTWKLTVWYLWPSSSLTSSVLSLCIGMIGHLVFGLFQDKLASTFHPDQHRIQFYVVSRLYTTFYAFTCVNSWRGAWELLDTYTEGELATVLATTMVSVISLAAMRALKNVSATPFVLCTDSAHGYFEIPTMFKAMNSNKTCMFVLDTFFSVFIIGTLVVFIWRGGWVLLDIFIYPNDFVWSSWISLIIGYLISVICFCMQAALRSICDRLTGFWRIFVSDLFLFVTIVGTVNVWRGIWNLLDIYFLPDHPEMSCWIIHIVSLVLLILLNCSNSLLVRGVYIDGEEPAGKCVIFPCNYLRLIFKHERARRQNNRLLLNSIEQRTDDKEFLNAKKDNCTCYKEQNHVILIQQIKSNHVDA